MPPSARRIPSTPKAKAAARERGVDLGLVAPTGRHGEVVASDVMSARLNKHAATPLAMRMALDRNIDLSSIRGSGHAGKVFSIDMPSAGKAGRPVRMSPMRKAVADRMLLSHTAIPPVTQNVEADVTAFLRFRKEMNASLPKEEGISVNDWILKAAAVALRENDRFRYQLNEGGGYLAYDEVNVGMAVSLDDGLIVPVIRRADALTVHMIAAESKRLASAARGRRLSPKDLEGGVFTVSNLGMYGVTSFTPIINHPEAAILGVCAPVCRLAMERDGTVAEHSHMTLSLTYDHRIINGAEAAVFANRIKGLLERPEDLRLI